MLVLTERSGICIAYFAWVGKKRGEKEILGLTRDFKAVIVPEPAQKRKPFPKPSVH